MPADEQTWEVLAIRFGTRTAVRSRVYLNYQVYKEDDGPIEMDYYFWVLRNGDRTILYDTGFNESSGARRGRTLLVDPATALDRLGIDVDAIDTTIVSHLHYDHAGNLDLAPNATVVIDAKEVAFWTSPVARRQIFAGSVEADDLASLDALDAAGRLRRFDGDTELAPGIVALEIGGHTPGQIVLSVQTASGQVLLASDAIHYYEEFELDRPFVEIDDLSDVFAGFDRVRALVDAGAVLVPGHDPAVMERFELLEPELAVRIA